MAIKAAVGTGKKNNPDDVKIVQEQLIRHSNWLGGVPAPQATGRWDSLTEAALKAFQTVAGALKTPDGAVHPDGFTAQRLELPVIEGPKHRVFRLMCWVHGPALTDTDFQSAATTLGCEVAAIKAVAKVETKRSPWFEIERPSILFERHYFRDLTRGIYNITHPDISGPQSYSAYGTFRAQYGKIGRAAMLDEDAALKSASWGMFQIMGANHKDAGHASVAAFVDAMMRGEREHLGAFVSFIASSPAKKKALAEKDWTKFTILYNGKGGVAHGYDAEMKSAYDSLVAPVPAARAGAAVR